MECGIGTFGNEQFVFYFSVCKHIRDFLLKAKNKKQKTQYNAKPIIFAVLLSYREKNLMNQPLCINVKYFSISKKDNLFTVKFISLNTHFLSIFGFCIFIFKDIYILTVLISPLNKTYFHWGKFQALILYTGNEVKNYLLLRATSPAPMHES